MDRYEKVLRILRKENKSKNKDGVSGYILIICVLVALFTFVTCKSLIGKAEFEQVFSNVYPILEENITEDTLYMSDSLPLLNAYNKANKTKTCNSKGIFFSMLYYEMPQDSSLSYADLQEAAISKGFSIEKDTSYNGFSFRLNNDTTAFVSIYESYLFICFCDNEKADSVKAAFCEILKEDKIFKKTR